MQPMTKKKTHHHKQTLAGPFTVPLTPTRIAQARRRAVPRTPPRQRSSHAPSVPPPSIPLPGAYTPTLSAEAATTAAAETVTATFFEQ
uniref:Uncharacterized protein n=1 Tax=Human herpesvirus 6B TaxID=32604 RepID=A0A2L2QCM4_HHV6H|nr:hypothetical protein [Human betaherpesvirus 6B]AVI08421.1 hypothetical protein [Human betaherpesvirus 6B]AVI08547.1 hypothetical protein [Human betaherpesvirus 6B]AVI08665.1 hypothetical protein [Human betaherpesvirus 6B]AVI08801.1 hypothetical protein [Human betaherpesvirus 6B]